MAEVLMCRPEYYTVSYKINPWMSLRRKPDKSRAVQQWTALYRALQKTGITVHLIDPVPELPDMVFTANAGLVFDHLFIRSNFRYPQRQRESAYFSEWARFHGMELRQLPEGHYFEGEGDALFFGEVLIAGYRFRSDIKSHLYLGNIINRQVLSVELVNPDYYHLDTCFCPLDHTSALYYPGAFDLYGRRVLQRVVPHLIPVPEEDARKFCCNAVVHGKNIILNICSAWLEKMLLDLDFIPTILNFDEFIKAGGSSKCMVLFLKKQENIADESSIDITALL